MTTTQPHQPTRLTRLTGSEATSQRATTQRAVDAGDAGDGGPLGRVIAASLACGALLAAALAFGPTAGRSEATVVGAALVASGSGWALLAVGSRTLTSRPQRWAAVPAAVLGLGGAALLVTNPGEPTMTRLAWVWAPSFIALATWVQRRAKRDVGGWRALPLYAVTVLMLLAGAGGIYEVGTQPADAAMGAAPGRLVDVGGYRLHLNCTGSGSPTVVLLNGLQETSPYWSRITPQVAASTRVCAYDRAGQGWSENSPHPADAAHVVADLHTLLENAGESGPFVLAGHSSGGVYALTYVARYRDEVAGMVLLDSASPHQVELMPSFTGQYRIMRRVAAVAPSLARTGIWHAVTAAFTPTLPADAGQQAARFAVSPRGLRNMRAEQAVLPTSFHQAQALTTLGATPLVVLTAQDTVDKTAGWGNAQNEMAALSTNTRHAVAPLNHVALLDDAAGAALSVRAITDVVAAAR
jgi:pimeloyl-ACP methyl ester carboxylesterase